MTRCNRFHINNILCIQPFDFRLVFRRSDFNADHKVLRTTFFCQIKFIYMLPETIHLPTSKYFFYQSKQLIHTSLSDSSEFLLKLLLIKYFEINISHFNCIFSSKDFSLEKVLTKKFFEDLII